MATVMVTTRPDSKAMCVFSPEEVESGWISRYVGWVAEMTNGCSIRPRLDSTSDGGVEEASQWYDTDSDGYGDNLEYFDGQT